MLRPMHHGDGRFELAKMAVDPSTGLGLGAALGEAIIAARAREGRCCFYNTVLKPRPHARLGFQEVPIDHAAYDRQHHDGALAQPLVALNCVQ